MTTASVITAVSSRALILAWSPILEPSKKCGAVVERSSGVNILGWVDFHRASFVPECVLSIGDLSQEE